MRHCQVPPLFEEFRLQPVECTVSKKLKKKVNIEKYYQMLEQKRLLTEGNLRAIKRHEVGSDSSF